MKTNSFRPGKLRYSSDSNIAIVTKNPTYFKQFFVFCSPQYRIYRIYFQKNEFHGVRRKRAFAKCLCNEVSVVCIIFKRLWIINGSPYGVSLKGRHEFKTNYPPAHKHKIVHTFSVFLWVTHKGIHVNRPSKCPLRASKQKSTVEYIHLQ